jgi:hypothetical protein
MAWLAWGGIVLLLGMAIVAGVVVWLDKVRNIE